MQSQDQITSFRANGYLVAENGFDPARQEYQMPLDGLIDTRARLAETPRTSFHRCRSDAPACA